MRKSVACLCVGLVTACFFSLLVCAQEQTSIWTDTIPPARIIANTLFSPETGKVQADASFIRGVTSPLGEGDPYKFIQILPGVSAGAEGMSATYVRGGNNGNNVITLDGVPMYGLIHLMGMTSSLSPTALRGVDFQNGGFDGSRPGSISSQLSLSSINPEIENPGVELFANNFFLGAGYKGRIGDKTGIVLTGRVSQLPLEFLAIKSAIPSLTKEIQSLGAGIFDVFLKATRVIGNKRTLSAFLYGGRDAYRFQMVDGWKEGLGWKNWAAAARYEDEDGFRWKHNARLSFSSFSNWQNVSLGAEEDALQMQSVVREVLASWESRVRVKDNDQLTLGAQGKFTFFNPGASSRSGEYISNRSYPVSGAIWSQYNWRYDRIGAIKTVVRGNLYYSDSRLFVVPEIDLSAEFLLGKSFWLTATLDRVAQFHHALEGMPLGWPMDLLVPSDSALPPETAWQFYAGPKAQFGNHSITLGAYYKRMKNLVYFSQATAMFSAAFTGWKSNVELGEGTSYGAEILYKYAGERLAGTLAYTLSKTGRRFDALNSGQPFPAKFDRRHILSVNATLKLTDTVAKIRELTSSFVLQSGHRESVKQYSYPSALPEDSILLPFYGNQPNNYQMPTYIRWDIGYCIRWENKATRHQLMLGVYNILNRHNPLMLTYDATENTWQELSLFPIMPNFSYKISF